MLTTSILVWAGTFIGNVLGWLSAGGNFPTAGISGLFYVITSVTSYGMRLNRAFPVSETIGAIGLYWGVISVMWLYRLAEKITNWVPLWGGK